MINFGRRGLKDYVLQAWRQPDVVAPMRGSLLRRFFILAFVLLLSSSLVGKAAPSAPATVTPAAASTAASATTFSGVNAVEMIAQAIEANLRSMKDNTDLKELGTYLLGFFILSNVIWIFVKGYVSASGLFGMTGDLIPLAILSGVTILCLNSDVGSLILASLDKVAAAISGLGGSAKMSVADLIRESMITTFSTLSNLWSIGGIASLNLSNLLELAPSIIMVIASFLAKLVAMAATTFLIALALCIFLATLITSQITAIIAIVLAPMFVPFLLFKPASFMFDGWLRFTLGAGMMKIIGLVMLQVTNVILATLGTISAQAATATANGSLEQLGVDMVLYCSMILLAALAAYLMAQVPSIATGLISGNGSSAGFSGWRAIASQSLATRAITGGMQIGRGGGGGGAGAQNTNAGSAVTRAMPQALKLPAYIAGAALSKVGGSAVAWSDTRRNKGVSGHGSGGERNIQRDTTPMSAGTARAYISYLEKANANQKNRETAPGSTFVGPPTPAYTLSKPLSPLASRKSSQPKK